MLFSLSSIWAFAGGIVPAIFWLWFWRKEDRLRPEPRRRIVMTFIAGMVAVVLVLPLERFLYELLGPTISTLTLFSWAAAEELLKFLAAYFAGLFRNRNYDEPIDAVIYLISAALGFSALENTFFLLNLVDGGFVTQSIMSGNMRFIGATLLHTLCSATLGAFLAFGFYKTRSVRRQALSTGILFAIGLHTLFNYFIMNHERSLFLTFGGVWVGILLLLFLFEKIKTIRN